MDEFARLEGLLRDVLAEIGQFRAAETGSVTTRSTTVQFADTSVLRRAGQSVQVLQEFYVQATRASRPDPITRQQAVRLIESFRRFPVQASRA